MWLITQFPADYLIENIFFFFEVLTVETFLVCQPNSDGFLGSKAAP